MQLLTVYVYFEVLSNFHNVNALLKGLVKKLASSRLLTILDRSN